MGGAGGDDVVNGDGGLGGDGATDDGAMVADPTLDQVKAAEINGSNISVMVTLTNLAIDDVVVAAVGWRSNGGMVSQVIDDNGNVYPIVCSLVRGGATSQELRVARVAAAGTATITVITNVSSTGLSIRAAVYKGVDPAGSFACWTGSGGGTSTATASGPVATVGSMIAVADTATVPSSTTGNGFTIQQSSPTFGDVFLDKRATMTGTQSVSVQLSAAGDWVMQGATLPP